MLSWDLYVGSDDDSNVVLEIDDTTIAMTVEEARVYFAEGYSLLAAMLTKLYEPDGANRVPSADELRHVSDAVLQARRRAETLSGQDETYPPLLSQMRNLLDTRGQCAVVGESAAGKSVLVNCLAREREADGVPILWLDLANPDVTHLACILALMRVPVPVHGKALVVLDDVQSSPAIARRIVSQLLAMSEVSVELVAVGWLDVREMFESLFGYSCVMHCDGRQTCISLLSTKRLPRDAHSELLNLAGSNALIAEIALHWYLETREVPHTSQIAARAYDILRGNRLFSSGELAALWVLACLAIFEIDVDIRYLDGEIRLNVHQLIRRGIAKQKRPFTSLGHRSLARLVVQHLRESKLIDLSLARDPVTLAVNYLRRAGDTQIKVALDRLDLITLRRAELSNTQGSFLARASTNAGVLVRQLGAMSTEDPSWGDNVASAIFVAEAFADLGLLDKWMKVAAYVRSRWLIDNGTELPSYVGSPPAERDDFDAIAKRMNREDDARIRIYSQYVSTIDLDRFHRTWVLGLLLGFEASALQDEETRIARLRSIVREVQLPSGAFYPERVPWVTARVCLEGYAKPSLKKCRPIAARNEDKKVFSGRL